MASLRNLLWGVPLIMLLTSPLWKPVLIDFLTPRYGFSPVYQEERDQGGFRMKGVQMTRSVNGQPEAILNADKVESGRWGENDYWFEQVDAVLFDKGQLQAHVMGGEGYYDDSRKILTLIEDVSVLVGDTYELRSEALRYLIPYKTVKTGMDIFFKSHDVVIKGTGMWYNFETGDYQVGGRVKFDMN